MVLSPNAVNGNISVGINNEKSLRGTNSNVYESSISIGSGYFCGISGRSEVYCWGTDPETGDSILRPEVVPAASGVDFVSVGMGVRFLCALSVEGAVYCKGAGYNGELGTGVNEAMLDDLTVPVQGDRVFKSLSVGYYHVCAIDINNDLYCWGDSEYGQVGAGDVQSSNVPVKVGENFKQVSAGGEHTCGVTLSNKGFCWGRNDMHQSSPSDSYSISKPKKIDGDWNSIYSGYDFTLGIDTSGDGFGWGVSEGISGESAAGGYLGQGRDFCLDFDTGEVVCNSAGGGVLTFEKTPIEIRGGKKWSMFAPGRVPCGIERDTRFLYCWGYTAGEAYAEGSPGTNVPTLVSEKAWDQIASGISGARCGLNTKGEAYCWGRNVYDCGETCPLGDGKVDNSAKPLKVKSGDVWRASKVTTSRAPQAEDILAPEPSPVATLPVAAPIEVPTVVMPPVASSPEVPVGAPSPSFVANTPGNASPPRQIDDVPSTATSSSYSFRGIVSCLVSIAFFALS